MNRNRARSPEYGGRECERTPRGFRLDLLRQDRGVLSEKAEGTHWAREPPCRASDLKGPAHFWLNMARQSFLKQ